MLHANSRTVHIVFFILILALSAHPVLGEIEITPVGHFGGWLNGMAVKDTYLFQIQAKVLTVFDISGGDFNRVASLELPDESMQIFISGDYAYTFDTWSDAAMMVINISNPLNPVYVTELDYSTIGDANGHVSGNYAYIAMWDSLAVINISNPLAPVLENVIEMPADHIAVSGNTGCVDTDEGLVIYDMTDPANPVQRGTYGNFVIDGLFVAGNYAYAGQQDENAHGLHVVDISNPDNPVQTGYVDIKHKEGNVNYLHNPRTIYVEGSIAYVGCDFSHIYTVDVSTPSAPAVLGHLELNPGSWASFTSFQAAGNMLCLTHDYTSGGPGLYILDAGDPANLRIQAKLEEPAELKHMAASNDTLYLSSDEALWIYKAANPSDPDFTLLGKEPRFQTLTRIFYRDQVIYGIRQDTLFLIDVSDPGNIHETGHYVSDEILRDLYVLDNYVYLINGITTGQLEIIDISAPGNPQKTTAYNLDAQARDIVVTRGSTLAYVAYYKDENDKGFMIIDVSDPVNPVMLTSAQTTGIPSCITVEKSLVIVGSNIGALGKTMPDRNDPRDISGLYNTRYIEAFKFKLGFNMDPVLKGTDTADGSVWDLKIVQNMLAAGVDGNCILYFMMLMDDDYADFDDFMFELYEECPSPAAAFIEYLWFEASMNYLFMSMDGYVCPDMLEAYASYGLFIQMLAGMFTDIEPDAGSLPLHFDLSQNYPNPFNPATTIEYRIETASRVLIQVFDIHGRQVMTLVDRYHEPGIYHKNIDARQLPSGTYLYQITTGDFRAKRKMLLIK